MLIPLLFLSGAFTTEAHAQPKAPPATAWGVGSAGYGEAMKLSDGKKPLIVYFYADWCPFCKRLNSQILATPEVEGYLGDIIRVKINPESGGGERALSELYNVKAFPAFIILSPATGKQRMIHPFHKGIGMSPAQFIEACQEAMAYVSQ
ncbi:MAG: thioredoxin fold domain-containing protein [Candidatus Kapaibacterium sp.]